MATMPKPLDLSKPPPEPLPPVTDHRSVMAQKKRLQMRQRIVMATTQVFAQRGNDVPVIEDVVRAAEISRGTFYKHFRSLDEALVAASTTESDQMIANILPMYDCLNEPWQRAGVGYRSFIVRAWQDPKWAAFFTRMEAWPHEALCATYMSRDLQHGRELGQFNFDDLAATTDFIMGASAGAIQALRLGVPDPHAYMDASVRLMLHAVDCSPVLREKAVSFSRKHLAEWLGSDRATWALL